MKIYHTIEEVLREMTPEEVVAQINRIDKTDAIHAALARGELIAEDVGGGMVRLKEPEEDKS